jgi:hypothetical protein
MRPRRSVSRRSFIGQVTGGIALFGSASAAQSQDGQAGVTDSDRYISDQPGQGQGQRSNITDKDPGDAVGNGRGNTMRSGTARPPERPPQNPFNESNERAAGTGATDSDPTDRVGYGRGTSPQAAPRSPFNESNERAAGTGVTDSDPTDRVGYGRGPQAPRTCTDSDVGSNADRVGAGRRCR